MSRGERLVKDTLIIAVGKISTQFLTFLLLPLYTAYLAPASFGTVDLILSYITLLAPLITVQLEMAAFRYLIDARGDENRIVSIISSILRTAGSLAVIASIVLFLLSTFIHIPYLWLFIGNLLSVIIVNMLLQITRGLGNILKYSVASVVAGITAISANIVFIVFLGMGIDGILLAAILGNLACAIYLSVSQRIYRYLDIWTRDIFLEKSLLRYSLPLVPNGLSWWLINAADRTIIAIVLGVASNGIYAVAYKFPVILSSLFSFFNMSWTESASVNIDNPDRDVFFSETMNASLRLFGALGLCILAGVSLLFGILISDSFAEAYLYIPILMLGAFFNSVVSLYGAIYIAKKMTMQVMNTSIIAASVTILLTVCLIGWLGLYAPAIAMVAGYSSMAIFRHFDVKKYVNIRYHFRSLAYLMTAFIIVCILYYINDATLNLVNMCLAIIFALLLNRSILSVIKEKVFTRLRPLTSEQQVLEEIEDKGI